MPAASVAVYVTGTGPYVAVAVSYGRLSRKSAFAMYSCSVSSPSTLVVTADASVTATNCGISGLFSEITASPLVAVPWKASPLVTVLVAVAIRVMKGAIVSAGAGADAS